MYSKNKTLKVKGNDDKFKMVAVSNVSNIPILNLNKSLFDFYGMDIYLEKTFNERKEYAVGTRKEANNAIKKIINEKNIIYNDTYIRETIANGRGKILAIDQKEYKLSINNCDIYVYRIN